MGEAYVKGAGSASGSTKKRGDFVPPGYGSCLEAITDVIRFGPEAFPGADFLALLWHVERTITYRKASDSASISQMVNGVFGEAGPRIRGGSGLRRSSAINANTVLLGRGILKVKHRKNERGHAPNRYTIDWEALKTALDSVRTLVQNLDHPVHEMDKVPLVQKMDKDSPRNKQGLVQNLDPGSPPDKQHRSHHQIRKKQRVLVKGSSSSGIPEQTVSGKGIDPETPSFFSLVDDDELARFREPRERLAYFIEKATGHTISERTLSRIGGLLELRGRNCDDLLKEIRANHNITRVSNVPGFLTSLAKSINYQLTPAKPVEVEPEPVKDLCEVCRCERGKGTIMSANAEGFEACNACATPQWRARVELLEKIRLSKRAARQCQSCGGKGYFENTSPVTECEECSSIRQTIESSQEQLQAIQ